MNQEILNKLDRTILKDLTQSDFFVIQDIDKLCKHLFSALEPVRITSWRLRPGDINLIRTYSSGADDSKEERSHKNRVESLLEKESEEFHHLVDFTLETDSSSSDPQTIAISGYSDSEMGVAIAIEFDEHLSPHHPNTEFLKRLSLYLRLFRQKTKKNLTSPTQDYQIALFTNLNPFPIIQFSIEGRVLFANPAAKRTFNLDRTKYVNFLIPQYSHDDLNNCINRGSIISKTSEIEGRFFQFVARGASGLGYGVLYGIDISERVKAERKLAVNHRFLRKVIDTNPNLIFVKDADGRFTLANQTVADIYGTTVDDIVGKSDSDFNTKDDEVESFRKDDMEVIHFQNELLINEEKVTDAHGKTRWLQTVKKPIRTHDNEIHVLGVATDITSLKNLQLQLNQSQKMEAIGQLAGGIAHDFNNLLTGILGYTNLLLSDENANLSVVHPAEMIEKAALQASQLTQKLLGFARKGKMQNIAVDIHETVLEVTHLLQRTVEENIQIKLHLDSETTHVLGDPIQMQQIVLNLVINARDAIHEKENVPGCIEITSEKISGAEALKLELPSLSDRSYLKVSFLDTGCGIPESHIDKIFEPFFTTKDPSKGTGMGLAMVYGIIENHGGAITVTSSVGEGSKFDVYLPVTDSIDDRVEKIKKISIQGKGQILLVDDHRMIRDVTSKMLSNLGYQVITAEDGIAAIEYYRQHCSSVDLIILDMIMPNMDALECFNQFKSINPDVRVVLSTGYVNNNRVQEILNEGMIGFVQKPYHLHELSQVVADALRFTHFSVPT